MTTEDSATPEDKEENTEKKYQYFDYNPIIDQLNLSEKSPVLTEELKENLIKWIEERGDLFNDTDSVFFKDRLKKFKALLDLGINPYPNFVSVSSVAFVDLKKHYQDSIKTGESTSIRYKIAGRIRSIRNKHLFVDIYDHTGKMQLMCAQDNLNEISQKLLPLLDIGDIVAAEGTLKKTQKNELSLDAQNIIFLSKCWGHIPEKHEGITDREKCHRKKHLDWIANDRACLLLRARSEIIKTIRNYMDQNFYTEVETPILHQRYGGAAALPFITHHNSLDENLYLRVSPELYLKRIMVGGAIDRVYEIGRNFRNEGISTRHNPEFTMLEAYTAYQDYDFALNMVENILQYVMTTLKDTLSVLNPKLESLMQSFPLCRRPMHDIILETTGLDVLKMNTLELENEIIKRGLPVISGQSWGVSCAFLFETFGEPTLSYPVHIVAYPKDISPLAKTCTYDARLTERFETFIGMEIANGYSELNNPYEQHHSFVKQKEAMTADEDKNTDDDEYVQALSYGMMPVAGFGIGIDRIIQILTGENNIRNIIAFPLMKTHTAEKTETHTVIGG